MSRTSWITRCCSLFVLSLFLTCVIGRSLENDKKIVCYYGAWSLYRPGDGKFTAEDIDPTLCTHLMYSFAGLDANTNQFKVLDPNLDTDQHKMFKKTVDLKEKNPDLKVMIAIGGWNEGSTKYSNMASNPQSRKTFIKSIMDFVDEYDFDGVDLDWEYPANRGGASSDVQNFPKFLEELKKVMFLY